MPRLIARGPLPSARVEQWQGIVAIVVSLGGSILAFLSWHSGRQEKQAENDRQQRVAAVEQRSKEVELGQASLLAALERSDRDRDELEDRCAKRINALERTVLRQGRAIRQMTVMLRTMGVEPPEIETELEPNDMGET